MTTADEKMLADFALSGGAKKAAAFGRVLADMVQLRAERDNALDALESMVQQYLLWDDRPGHYDHMYMTAGEEACELLVKMRPHKWRAKPYGMERVSDG